MLDFFDAFGRVDLERSAADIAAGRVRLSFGGTTYTLPVRSIGANRDWLEGLDAGLGALLNSLRDAGEATPAILRALAPAIEPMIAALYDFDHTHVLPPRADLEEVATEVEVVRATAEVWLAANPLVAIALAKSIQTMRAQIPEPPTSDTSEPTNSPPPSTASPSEPSSES